MFFILHILLMTTAFAGIMAGVSMAVFARKKKNWLKIHKSSNALGLGVMAAGIVMAFSYTYTAGGKHFNGTHQIAGLLTFILVFITLLAGLYQFRARNKSMARTAHRWLGRFALPMLLTSVILGLILINVI